MDPRVLRIVMASLALGLATLVVTRPAQAQFPKEGLELYSQLAPNQFGASGGNDCWGYVSPTGREYALMSLNNRLGVVEITDPRNPSILGTIPHSSCTWGDVKVYKDHCYQVSECNSGIQVVDLSDVDNGNISLVRTISSPGSSHNVVVDTESGYLFTVGSGRTYSVYIYDLEPANGRGATPGNPVFVQRFAGNYLHDAQAVTYDKGGPNERVIIFGASEGRGLEIYELKFTNGNPAWRMVSSESYPGVSYCHQLWLDKDRHYLYGDDELDEQRGQTPTTRSLVFDVSDLDNPVYVGSFTSGLPSIDHNLYVREDGMIFEANYSSGVRVFDTNVSKTSPPEVAYFDTYPENNNASFNGLWSVYPFFPSGTVIASDTGRGLFILDSSGISGGISCDEVKKFKGKCKKGKGKATVKLTNAGHDGEEVTVEVEGSPFDLQINGSKAKLVTCCFEGSIDLVLTSPSGCKDPINAACN